VPVEVEVVRAALVQLGQREDIRHKLRRARSCTPRATVCRSAARTLPREARERADRTRQLAPRPQAARCRSAPPLHC
jgi:hypothetical protein